MPSLFIYLFIKEIYVFQYSVSIVNNNLTQINLAMSEQKTALALRLIPLTRNMKLS